MKKIFIDGASGTTGLMIQGLVKPMVEAGQLELISIPNTRDVTARMDAFEAADVSILCLPDDAARETVQMLAGKDVRLIDASSAHRVAAGWVFGFPELHAGHADVIRDARLVSNPGCYATGAISILRPLVTSGLLGRGELVTIVGASGYTGGGKKLIELHERGGEEFSLANVFGAYSLDRPHKHAVEIQTYAELSQMPIFLPHVLNVPRGIIVSVTFRDATLGGGVVDVQRVYERAYGFEGSKVRVMPLDTKGGRLNYEPFVPLNAKGADAPPFDTLDIHVKGWEAKGHRQMTVLAVLDNLGKGAGTQAIQNLKLMCRL